MKLNKVADSVVVIPKKDSVLIESVKYVTSDKLLTIKFRNQAVYSYENVPVSVFNEFLEADSLGKYFSTNIRDTYKSNKEISWESL